VPGNVGIKFKNGSNTVYIPTGGEIRDVSGEIEFFTYGLHRYELKESLTTRAGDLALLTEKSQTLKLTIVGPQTTKKTYVTTAGKPRLGATPQPRGAPRGVPDTHLEVDDLAMRFIRRLHVISASKLGHVGNSLFFSATSDDGDDKFDQLMAAMSSASADPKTEVKNGVPPATSRVKMIPGFTVEDRPDQLRRLDKAMSIISLYQHVWSISMRTKRGHPQAYKISVAPEASQLNADLADAAAICLTGPLSGYFTATQTQQQGLHKEMFSTEIHMEFIGALFTGFSIPDSTKKSLDGLLTNVVSSLSSLNISSASADADVNHYTLIPTLKQIVMVGNDGKDEVVGIQPIIRAMYLHVTESTWSVSIGKSSAEKVKFDMNYADLTFTINQETFDKFADKMDAIIMKLVKKNCADFGKDLSMPVGGDVST
jgi:hypothetical protein